MASGFHRRLPWTEGRNGFCSTFILGLFMTLRSMALAGLSVLCLAVTPVAMHLTAASAEPIAFAKASSSTTPSTCFIDRPQTALAAAAPAVNGVQVRINVQVASLTRLRLDKNGSIEAIGTNTGCAPKATDEFAVEKSATDYTPASPDLIASALRCTSSGDWDDTTLWHHCH
jgi:hypothetical protein